MDTLLTALNLIQQRFHEECEERLHNHISKHFGKTRETKEYLQKLTSFVLNGGKRTRPLFLFIGSGYFEDFNLPANLWDFAIGIELIHAGMLMHDDIIDESDLRRGKPSMHTVIGENNTIVLGDIAWSLGFDFLLQAPIHSRFKEKAIKEFVRATISTGEGQLLDMKYAPQCSLTKKLLYTIYELKTAKYSVEAPLVMGAYSAGKEHHVPALRAIGKDLGLLFQLQDDIIDIKKDGETGLLSRVRCNPITEKSVITTRVKKVIDKDTSLPQKTRAILIDIVDFLDERTS